jgi:hypothetical protein
MVPLHPGRKSRPFDLAAASLGVHRFVARRVHNADDAADIAQQALLLAFEPVTSSVEAGGSLAPTCRGGVQRAG